MPVQVTALATMVRDAMAGVKLQPASNAHDQAISGLKLSADCIIAA
jgi:hypothetical protein